MKVVHVSALHLGGAANAAERLHQGLLQSGVESVFVTKFKHNSKRKNHLSYMEHRSIRHFINAGLERYLFKNIFPPLRGYTKDTVLFTSPHSLYHPEILKVIEESDIVHLHWISHFVDYESFFKRINKPVVWTLHDMNPFTGGCHYSGDCTKYETTCTECPQIIDTKQPMAANNYFEYKVAALKSSKNLAIVTPSTWLLNLSKKSFLFKDFPHYHIRHGFNTAIFTLLDRQVCRKKWGIPENKINLLFVVHSSTAKMKGFDMLIQALDLIPGDRLHLTIAGKQMDTFQSNHISYTSFGYVQDEEILAEIYNTGDLFITPSLRDNLPNTVGESLLCGTPVLCFNIGGLSEMITPGINGLFASGLDAQSLANAILHFINEPGQFDRNKIHEEAKRVYDLNRSTRQYVDLYRALLNRD
ncbi:MAG: glycosyltransferase [Saprospiraceae bacterium]